MYTQPWARFAPVAAAAVALAACAGGNATPPTSGSPALGAARDSLHPDARSARLLYATDFNNDSVGVYAYPSGTPAGTLTGFSNPQGVCVDSADRNVFIANTGAENVLEYAYGASTPEATWSDPGEYPVGCSVDPSTGNLAISDIFSPTTGQGAVTICAKPSRCTTYVEPGGLLECYFIAYVPNGDLYVDGIAGGTYGFGMAYLRAGSSAWKPVHYRGETIAFPGGVQWDGKYLAVGDQSAPSGSVIHRCKTAGVFVNCDDRVVGLLGSGDVAGFFIKPGGKGVVAAVSGAIDTWNYPAGGNPVKMFSVGQSYFGVAIVSKP